MRRYNGYSNGTNTTSTTAPLAGLGGAATTRARMYEFDIGSDATPQDAGFKFSFRRTSTSGTGPTLVTANALDAADPAALCFWASTWTTTQPTITASSDVLQVAMNQRATFRWVAVPDSELVVPASVNNFLVLMSVVASATANYAWSALWQE
jgi:hypothetical protein